MPERPRLSCIPRRTLQVSTRRAPRPSGEYQGFRPRSGDSGHSAHPPRESFPSRPTIPDIDQEPLTEFVENCNGYDVFIMQIPGVSPANGPFDRLPDESDNEKSTSFSSIVVTPDGEASLLIISFFPGEGIIKWRYGLPGPDIPLPEALGDSLPDRVDSNNSLITASFNMNAT